MFAEISAPVQDLQCGAISWAIRPTPHPISSTSSRAWMDASSSRLRTLSVAELRNLFSLASPAAAIAASFMEPASESHTAAYSWRRQWLSGGQSLTSFNARTEYPQTKDEHSKQIAAAIFQTALARSAMVAASKNELAIVAVHGNQECLRKNADAACSLSFIVTRPEVCICKSQRVYLFSSALRISADCSYRSERIAPM